MLLIKQKKLRTLLRVVVPFLLIPCLAVAGTVVFEGKRYIIVSLAIALFSLMVFFSGYERRIIGTRRIIVAAVMIALGVAGRFIPIVMPVAAITILSGIYLGGETGFMVGALIALISDMYFGQGPWTAFQMLAWGLIGFAAGLLSEVLKSKKWSLLFFGAVGGIAYSLIMDVWSVLWYSDGFSMKLYMAAIISAAPFTAAYVISNVVWLWLLAEPIGEKLERIRVKYGL